MKNYILISHFLSLIITIVVTSSDGRDPEFCQWETFNVSSAKRCSEKCSSPAKGFHHPISNELICFKKKSIAKPWLVEELDFGFYNCNCVDHSTRTNVYSCNPTISYKKLTSSECTDACAQYTAYRFEKNNITEAYCSEESSQVEELSLDFLTSLEHRSSNSNHKTYYITYRCRCGLHLKELQKRERKKMIQRKIAKPMIQENNEEFLLKCPMEPSILPSTDAMNFFCSEKCSSYMGYITTNDEFLCFNRIDSATDISSHNELCQCGLLKTINYRQLCTPDLTLPLITDPDLCQSECSSHTVLRQYEKNNLEIFWCGRITNPNNIFTSMDWSITKKKETGKRLPLFDCSCGLKTKNKTLLSFLTPSHSLNQPFLLVNEFSDILSTDEEIIFNLNGQKYIKGRYGIGEANDQYDFADTCKMEPFVYKSKNRCITSCFEAKAFFLHDSTSELICYHYEKPTEDISFSDNLCECGIRVDEGVIISCHPEIIVSTNNRELCFDICSNMFAYIFETYPIPSITRCIERGFSPGRLFEKLDSKIGKYYYKSEIVTENGTRFNEIPCECGISSFLRNNYTTPLKNSSGAGPSRTSLIRKSNERVSEFILNDNSFEDSNELSQIFPNDDTPGIDIFDKTIENYDRFSRNELNFEDSNSRTIPNDPSNFSSITVNNPNIADIESLEAYLINDEYVPAEDLNIPTTSDQYITENNRDSQSFLQANTYNSFLNINENNVPTRTASTRDILRDNNNNDNNNVPAEVISNALSNTYITIDQFIRPPEYDLVEAFLMNDDFSVPVGDLVLPSSSYEHEMRGRESLHNFEIGMRSDKIDTNEEVRESQPSRKRSRKEAR